ncbi:hypothetical protein MKX07_003616 [Trichoderma sp. CBMAI-0711]|uniref:SSCRP protein n=1 Tax=Trichoderma parareesei TaxID=858221 RepID=A0A2H2Z968_TRIPA|nr:hypothetical protein MKX07_003616 [Trichoderma sp. CBMAI-0711]OTA00230.1 hypothetical protein A9Z42_0062630 [Trichoderma parareesei]
MRGLSKAATLVLAPAAVLARPVPTNVSLREIPAESAFSVAIAVPTGASRDAKTADQPLVLNLDIQESSEACAPAKVRIDGFLLAQDDTGAGQGTFASLDGRTVTASWNFTCREHEHEHAGRRRGGGVPWDQDLVVTIMSLDGEAIAPEASSSSSSSSSTFVTSFRQRTPVKVYDVGGDSVVYTTDGRAPSRRHQERLLERIKGLTGVDEVDGRTKADVGDIVSLENQMRELGERIKDKQRMVLDRLGIRMPTTTTTTLPALGGGMQTFYQTAKLASSTLRGTMEHWLGSVLGFPPVVRHDSYRHWDEAGSREHHHRVGQHAHPEHRDDGVVVSMQVDGQGGQRFYYYRDDADSSSTRLIPTPPPRNVGYVPLFATIFTFHLGLYFILRSIRQRMHSRRSRSPGHRRHPQRHSPRSSSNNNNQEQSTASLLRESVRDLFRATRHVEVDEKTRLMMMTMHEGDDSTTMEDELASFQEAASLFSDVVAAAAAAAVREDEDGRLPRFVDDVSPPAYDDDDDDDDVQGRFDEKRPDGC